MDDETALCAGLHEEFTAHTYATLEMLRLEDANIWYARLRTRGPWYNYFRSSCGILHLPGVPPINYSTTAAGHVELGRIMYIGGAICIYGWTRSLEAIELARPNCMELLDKQIKTWHRQANAIHLQWEQRRRHERRALRKSRRRDS
jgi:hypothetical protein